MLRGGRRQKLLRCPAGAWPVRRRNRGPRPLGRACPRLISCGVPPGRRARCRRELLGRRLADRAAAESSQHSRILQSWSTEKTKILPVEIGSLGGDFLEPMPFLVFLCVHRVSVVVAAVSTAWKRLNFGRIRAAGRKISMPHSFRHWRRGRRKPTVWWRLWRELSRPMKHAWGIADHWRRHDARGAL